MNLSLIAITFPIFIILLSRILYKELLTVKKGIGITLVLTGVLFLITKGKISILLNISFAIGDVWMLIASIIFAIYSLFLKNKPEGLSVKIKRPSRRYFHPIFCNITFRTHYSSIFSIMTC